MRIEATKADLVAALKRAALSSSVEHPAIVVVASEAGVEVRGSRLTLSSVAVLEATVEAGGTVAAPAKDLVRIVGAMPDGPVTLTRTDRHLVIRGGSSQSTIDTVDAESVSAASDGPDGPARLTLPAEALGGLIGRVARFADATGSRPHLSAVKLELRLGRLLAIATDGHRIAALGAATDRDDIGGDVEALVPLDAARAIEGLCKAAADGASSAVHFADRHLHVVTPAARLVCVLADDSFPPWRQVTERGGDDVVRSTRLDREEAIDVVRRVVTSLGDESGIRLAASEGGEIAVTGADKAHRIASEGAIPIIDGGAMAEPIGVSGRYLLEALGAMVGETVTLETVGPLDPIRLLPGAPLGDSMDGDLIVVMPMRI